MACLLGDPMPRHQPRWQRLVTGELLPPIFAAAQDSVLLPASTEPRRNPLYARGAQEWYNQLGDDTAKSILKMRLAMKHVHTTQLLPYARPTKPQGPPPPEVLDALSLAAKLEKGAYPWYQAGRSSGCLSAAASSPAVPPPGTHDISGYTVDPHTGMTVQQLQMWHAQQLKCPYPPFGQPGIMPPHGGAACHGQQGVGEWCKAVLTCKPRPGPPAPPGLLLGVNRNGVMTTVPLPLPGHPLPPPGMDHVPQAPVGDCAPGTTEFDPPRNYKGNEPEGERTWLEGLNPYANFNYKWNKLDIAPPEKPLDATSTHSAASAASDATQATGPGGLPAQLMQGPAGVGAPQPGYMPGQQQPFYPGAAPGTPHYAGMPQYGMPPYSAGPGPMQYGPGVTPQQWPGAMQAGAVYPSSQQPGQPARSSTTPGMPQQQAHGALPQQGPTPQPAQQSVPPHGLATYQQEGLPRPSGAVLTPPQAVQAVQAVQPGNQQQQQQQVLPWQQHQGPGATSQVVPAAMHGQLVEYYQNRLPTPQGQNQMPAAVQGQYSGQPVQQGQYAPPSAVQPGYQQGYPGTAAGPAYAGAQARPTMSAQGMYGQGQVQNQQAAAAPQYQQGSAPVQYQQGSVVPQYQQGGTQVQYQQQQQRMVQPASQQGAGQGQYQTQAAYLTPGASQQGYTQGMQNQPQQYQQGYQQGMQQQQYQPGYPMGAAQPPAAQQGSPSLSYQQPGSTAYPGAQQPGSQGTWYPPQNQGGASGAQQYGLGQEAAPRPSSYSLNGELNSGNTGIGNGSTGFGLGQEGVPLAGKKAVVPAAAKAGYGLDADLSSSAGRAAIPKPHAGGFGLESEGTAGGDKLALGAAKGADKGGYAPEYGKTSTGAGGLPPLSGMPGPRGSGSGAASRPGAAGLPAGSGATKADYTSGSGQFGLGAETGRPDPPKPLSSKPTNAGGASSASQPKQEWGLSAENGKNSTASMNKDGSSTDAKPGSGSTENKPRILSKPKFDDSDSDDYGARQRAELKAKAVAVAGSGPNSPKSPIRPTALPTTSGRDDDDYDDDIVPMTSKSLKEQAAKSKDKLLGSPSKPAGPSLGKSSFGLGAEELGGSSRDQSPVPSRPGTSSGGALKPAAKPKPKAGFGIEDEDDDF